MSSDKSIIHLFNSLKTEEVKENLTVEQKELLIKKISKLDGKGQELLYVIIKSHQLENRKDFLEQLPYEGKFTGKNLRFDVDKFPKDLIFMVSKFVEMHVSLMEEEDKRLSLEKLTI